MMKAKILVYIFIVMNLTSCLSSKDTVMFIDPYEFKKLENHICKKPKGKIKSIYSFELNYNVYEFPNPNKTEKVKVAYSNGDLKRIAELSHIKKEYSTKGLLTNILVNKKLIHSYIYKNNKILSAKEYKSDSLLKKTEFITDEFGRIIKVKTKDINDTILEEIDCKYDGVEIVEYNYKGKYSWGYTKKLDNLKRVVSSNSLKYVNGKFIIGSEYYSYKYLNKNKREKKEENLKWIEELNRNNKVIRRSIIPEYAKNSKYEMMQFEYNEKGMLTKEIWSNKKTADSILIEYIYKYDNKGNVIYFARKSNINSTKERLDWETYYYNEYY